MRVYALVNPTGRTGWDSSTSRWITGEIVALDRSGYAGPVRDIERVKADKATGSYFLVVTVESDRDKGEPSSRAGSGYLVGAAQVKDWDGYQAALAAKRAKQDQAVAEQQAKYEAAQARRIELESKLIEELIEKDGLTGEVADTLRRLVKEGRIETA